MSKFKVGDKVVRTGNIFGEAKKGGVYEVSEVSEDLLNLKGHTVSSNYDARSFELHIEDHLTPLEAAKALLNREELQVFDELDNEWYRFYCDLSDVTLKDLESIKLRFKPKTVVINSVEVAAPAKKEDIEHYFYVVNFSENIVHTIDKMYINNNFKHYWATEEDAQRVLDAMLLPFTNLDKGGK